MVTIKKVVAKKPLAKKQDGGTSNDDKGILTPDNRLKSRRVRSADVSSYGSDASVTRTKLNGDKVTKSYKTTNGFVPNSKKTKTVTDKEGNVKSTETSPIDVNKAARKTNRIVNNIGRNKNDSWSVMKKGGVVKPKAQLGAIVKGIKAIGKGASKLNEMRPMVKYKNYVPGGHGKKALLKQGAEMAIIGGAGTAAAGKALLSGAKKPVVKKKK